MSALTGCWRWCAMIPLFSVLIMLVVRRRRSESGLTLFTELPPAAKMAGGGVGNALVGTVARRRHRQPAQRADPASSAAIFLAEFGPLTRTATVVRFATKVLTGLPSILAGVFSFMPS